MRLGLITHFPEVYRPVGLPIRFTDWYRFGLPIVSVHHESSGLSHERLDRRGIPVLAHHVTGLSRPRTRTPRSRDKGIPGHVMSILSSSKTRII